MTSKHVFVSLHRALIAATSPDAKRYYFGIVKVSTCRITLSVLTSSELPPDLRAIKKSLGVPLVKFADVNVELDPFIRQHPFETMAFLLESLIVHYSEVSACNYNTFMAPKVIFYNSRYKHIILDCGHGTLANLTSKMHVITIVGIEESGS